MYLKYGWPAGRDCFSEKGQRDAGTKHPKQKAFLSLSPTLVPNKFCHMHLLCLVTVCAGKMKQSSDKAFSSTAKKDTKR